MAKQIRAGKKRRPRTYGDKVRAGNQMYGPGCCAHNRLGGTAHKSPTSAPGIPWNNPNAKPRKESHNDREDY